MSVLTGHIRLWQVVVLALLFGTLSAVDNPARQAFVPEVVGRDLVRDAVTLNSTTVNVARVIGPTIAAVLVACMLVGAASVTFLTTGNTTIQLASDPRYRSRVTALWSMALVGSTPIGAPIVGRWTGSTASRSRISQQASSPDP